MELAKFANRLPRKVYIECFRGVYFVVVECFESFLEWFLEFSRVFMAVIHDPLFARRH